MLDEWSNNLLVHDPMRIYRAKRDASRKTVAAKYHILGFISSGTYGRVYKAQSHGDSGRLHAIKKFKPDKEGDVITYTGISQSAIREIAVRVSSAFLVLSLNFPLAQPRDKPRECCLFARSHPRGQVDLHGV